MIMDNPRITQAAIADELGLTIRAVKKSIKELIGEGIVERIGAARGGIWKINIDSQNREDFEKVKRCEVF